MKPLFALFLLIGILSITNEVGAQVQDKPASVKTIRTGKSLFLIAADSSAKEEARRNARNVSSPPTTRVNSAEKTFTTDASYKQIPQTTPEQKKRAEALRTSKQALNPSTK
jgi:hypothetical protein